ncbi:MAG: hypothetical protein ACXVEH_12410, partial [Nocardioides sp.]
MGRLLETLPNLSLARPGLDRRADRRVEPGLLPTLLADPGTRVLVLHGDQAELREHRDGERAAPSALVLRGPEPDDATGL